MLRGMIESLLSGNDLSEDQAACAMEEIMDGRPAPALTAAYLVALRAKGESAAELLGSAKAMRRRSLHAEPGIEAIDMCGTGGDGRNTFNVSTTAAFIAAAAGLSVAKHGNRAASSRCGSADLLEALGARISLPPEAAAECVRRTGFGFFFAQDYHPAMRNVAHVRKDLGIRTVFNVLGPLANPAGVRAQLLGVFSESLVTRMAEVLSMLGVERGCVVHGLGGWDEATTAGPNAVAVIESREIRRILVDPRDLGFRKAEPEELRGGAPKENAEITLAVLSGGKGAALDTAVLNAGLALHTCGRSLDLAAGVKLALEAVESGAALKTLERFVRLTHEL